jgi:hypothetical protein
MTGRVYRKSTVDTAVTQLNAAASEAMDLAIPYKCSSSSKYPCWFYSILKYYISKKNYFHHYKKTKSGMHYSYFAFFRKLVTVTVKSDRQNWLKFVDDIVSETIPIISGSTFLILKGRITLLFNSKLITSMSLIPN